MESRCASLIHSFLKSGNIQHNQFLVSGVSALENQLADILHTAHATGLQHGALMISHMERAISTREIGAGLGMAHFLRRSKQIVNGILSRVRDMIDKILNSGGSEEEAAVAMDRLIDSLPDLIATTEITTEVEMGALEAFNQQGVMQVEWRTEPGACPICITNEEAGPINLGQSFPSGDEQPPAHPRCRCNIVPAEINPIRLPRPQNS